MTRGKEVVHRNAITGFCRATSQACPAVLAGTGQAARLDNLFAQLDADQDGLITPKEFETETH
jgi:hypothetical protein